MADYATTNTTPTPPADPSLTEKSWLLKPFLDFSDVMILHPYPRTPIPLGSEPRSNVGLVFPR